MTVVFFKEWVRLAMLFSVPRRTGPVLLLVTTLLFLTGCTRAINRSAERRIRDTLPNVLGPARQYRVHVENDAGRTIRGRLSHVIIDGDDVQFPNGLLIDNLHLDLKGVDVDTKNRILRHIESARFTATIGEKSIDEFLVGESPEGENLRNTRLKFGANKLVTISSERVVLGVGVPFELTGPVHIAGPSRLEIDARHLTVVGIGLAGKPLAFLKNRFERAIDVSTLPFPVMLTDVTTAPGTITLTGDADVNDIVRQAQQRK